MKIKNYFFLIALLCNSAIYGQIVNQSYFPNTSLESDIVHHFLSVAEDDDFAYVACTKLNPGGGYGIVKITDKGETIWSTFITYPFFATMKYSQIWVSDDGFVYCLFELFNVLKLVKVNRENGNLISSNSVDLSQSNHAWPFLNSSVVDLPNEFICLNSHNSNAIPELAVRVSKETGAVIQTFYRKDIFECASSSCPYKSGILKDHNNNIYLSCGPHIIKFNGSNFDQIIYHKEIKVLGKQADIEMNPIFTPNGKLLHVSEVEVYSGYSPPCIIEVNPMDGTVTSFTPLIPDILGYQNYHVTEVKIAGENILCTVGDLRVAKYNYNTLEAEVYNAIPLNVPNGQFEYPYTNIEVDCNSNYALIAAFSYGQIWPNTLYGITTKYINFETGAIMNEGYGSPNGSIGAPNLFYEALIHKGTNFMAFLNFTYLSSNASFDPAYVALFSPDSWSPPTIKYIGSAAQLPSSNESIEKYGNTVLEMNQFRSTTRITKKNLNNSSLWLTELSDPSFATRPGQSSVSGNDLYISTYKTPSSSSIPYFHGASSAITLWRLSFETGEILDSEAFHLAGQNIKPLWLGSDTLNVGVLLVYSANDSLYVKSWSDAGFSTPVLIGAYQNIADNSNQIQFLEADSNFLYVITENGVKSINKQSLEVDFYLNIDTGEIGQSILASDTSIIVQSISSDSVSTLRNYLKPGMELVWEYELPTGSKVEKMQYGNTNKLFATLSENNKARMCRIDLDAMSVDWEFTPDTTIYPKSKALNFDFNQQYNYVIMTGWASNFSGAKHAMIELINQDGEEIYGSFDEDLYGFDSQAMAIAQISDSKYLVGGRLNSSLKKGFVYEVENFGCLNQTTTIDTSACASFTAPDGEALTQSGTYYFEFISQEGCDSTLVLNLTVSNIDTTLIDTVSCLSYTAPDGEVLTQPGTYNFELVNQAGCDSTVILNLAFSNIDPMEIDTVACLSYTAPNGEVLSQSGTYSIDFLNQDGCESTLLLNLTVTSVDHNVQIDDNILIATQSNGTYQWFECNEELTEIQGATMQSYSPFQSGLYAVEITADNCSVTSDCISFIHTNLANYQIELPIEVRPNPTEQYISIITELQHLNFELYSINGKSAIHGNLENMNTIDLKSLPPGIYILKISNSEAIWTRKVVKL